MLRLFREERRESPGTFLAGAGIEPAGVAEDGEVLSRHRERPADSHRFGPGAGAGDAGGTSGFVQIKMESAQRPKLQFLHTDDAMSPVKLESFRRLSTDTIKSSLHPSQPSSLKVRPDGTVLDGHHRLSILLERGEDIHQLPREIMERES